MDVEESRPFLLLNYSYFGQKQLFYLLDCLKKKEMLTLTSRKESYESGLFSIYSGFWGVFIVISMILNLLT